MDYKLFDRSQQQQQQTTNSGTRKVLGTTHNRALQEGNSLQKRGEVPNNKIRNDVNKRGTRDNENQNRLKPYAQNQPNSYANPDPIQYEGQGPDQFRGTVTSGYQGYQTFQANPPYQEYYYQSGQDEQFRNTAFVQDDWRYNDQTGADSNYYMASKFDPYLGGNQQDRYGSSGANQQYDYQPQPAQLNRNHNGYNYDQKYHPEGNWNPEFQQYHEPNVHSYGFEAANQGQQSQMYTQKPGAGRGGNKAGYSGYNQGYQQQEVYQENYEQPYPDYGTPIPQQSWRNPNLMDQGHEPPEQYYAAYNNWGAQKPYGQDQQWNQVEMQRVHGRNLVNIPQVIIPICLKEDKSLVIQHIPKQEAHDMIPAMSAFSRSDKSTYGKNKLLQTWMKKSIKEGLDQKNHAKVPFSRPKLERSQSVDPNFFQKLIRKLPQKKTQHRQPSYLDTRPRKKTTRSNSFVYSGEFEGKVRIDRDLQRKSHYRPKSKMATTEKGSAANSVSVKQQPSVNLQKSEVTTTVLHQTAPNMVTPAKKIGLVTDTQEMELTSKANLHTPSASPNEPKLKANMYSGVVDSSNQLSYKFDSGILGDISRSLADFDDSRMVNASKGNDQIVSQASILKLSPTAAKERNHKKDTKEKDVKATENTKTKETPPTKKENKTPNGQEETTQKQAAAAKREAQKDLLTKLLRLGQVKMDTVVSFDKLDPVTQESVKFVAFEIATHKYNDHFISVKPEVLPYRDGENERGDHRGEGRQGYANNNKRYGAEQQTWNYQQGGSRPNGQKGAAVGTLPGKTQPTDSKKPLVSGSIPGAPAGTANWEKKKPEGAGLPVSQPKDAPESDAQPKPAAVNGKELVQQLEATEKMPILEQAMHKVHTGKLQRWLKKLTDDEKVAVFKQIKHTLHELLLDQYGKYVVVLFLKTNLTAIVDTLISTFDKMMDELVRNKHGALFCQSLIDVKFKDVRLRRVLKRIDKNLPELIQDDTSAQTVLAYVTVLPPAEMADFVEYCKSNFRVCIGSHLACKIFAKVLSKVSDVERLEIELHLKTIMAQIFESKEGVELVEVFITKADTQNMQGLLSRVYGKILGFLKSEDHEYFFAKITELKNREIMNEVISRIFLAPGCPSDQEIVDLVNHEVANRTLLSFFTMTSFDVKDQMRRKLATLQANPAFSFSQNSKKLLSLCENYFGSSSLAAP